MVTTQHLLTMMNRVREAHRRCAMFIARVLAKEYEPRQGFHQTKFISFDPEALHFGVDEFFVLNPYGVREMIYVSCYKH